MTSDISTKLSVSYNKKHLKNVGPIAARRCPQQQQQRRRRQRQRVTEGTAMAS